MLPDRPLYPEFNLSATTHGVSIHGGGGAGHEPRMQYLGPTDTTGVNSEHYTIVREEIPNVPFVLDIIFIAVSLLGNGCVLCFICGGQKQVRNATNITIVSLCLADILVATIVIPSSIAFRVAHHWVSPYLCKIYQYISYLTKTASAYSICAMILDRFYCIVYPKKTAFTAGLCMFFMCFVWFFGAAYNIWIVVIYRLEKVAVQSDNGANATVRRICDVSNKFRHVYDIFVICDFAVLFAVPFSIMITLVTWIIKKVFAPDSKNNNREQMYVKCKRLRMGVLLAFIHIVCQMPIQVLKFYSHWGLISTSVYLRIYGYLEPLSFAHGVCNIIVYTTFNSDVKRALRELCGYVDEPRLLRIRDRRKSNRSLLEETNLDEALT